MSELKQTLEKVRGSYDKLFKEFYGELPDEENKLTDNEIRAIWMTVLFGFVCVIAILIAFLAMLVRSAG
jgi:hypothetical protein